MISVLSCWKRTLSLLPRLIFNRRKRKKSNFFQKKLLQLLQIQK
ncbi:hypothetical protein D7Y25_11610 [Parabacteroides goldsteinii]|nr:hypothetical protein [Parabacteroides goldsteinii]NDO64237.1 hypothetical protein [Parabacteroides goldsteinii]RLT85020.1 hypothetical protein D7Y25_11610 [Parabacteroides goldsteinii]TFU71943.1 hypothetical protein E4T94_15685 [Parabacteroides sp. P14]